MQRGNKRGRGTRLTSVSRHKYHETRFLKGGGRERIGRGRGIGAKTTRGTDAESIEEVIDVVVFCLCRYFGNFVGFSHYTLGVLFFFAL